MTQAFEPGAEIVVRYVVRGWKINLEAPKRRTPIGFDTTDHYLDVPPARVPDGWDAVPVG